jgi:tRNA dimethylallyltransferase
VQSKAKLIVVIGPTAVGKSAKAMELAPQVGGEIVSADSRHVYRGMDIGTNKPTQNEQARVRHHLLDIRAPHEPFSLAEYLQLAREAMDDITRRGKTPMLVGGTGQYVKAVLEGWQVPEVPPNEEIRQRWLDFAESNGIEALNRELVKRDVKAAATIDPRNVRRVVRALEVMEITGEKWSDLQRKNPLDQSGVQMVNVTLPREELHKRADARVEQMVRDGWLNETHTLLNTLAQQGYDANAAKALPSMSALGYREMTDVALGTLPLADAIAKIKTETHRYIRMQDAWFRPYLR